MPAVATQQAKSCVVVITGGSACDEYYVSSYPFPRLVLSWGGRSTDTFEKQRSFDGDALKRATLLVKPVSWSMWISTIQIRCSWWWEIALGFTLVFIIMWTSTGGFHYTTGLYYGPGQHHTMGWSTLSVHGPGCSKLSVSIPKWAIAQLPLGDILSDPRDCITRDILRSVGRCRSVGWLMRGIGFAS